MRTLTIAQLVGLHILVLEKDGGAEGIRDIGRLEAAVASQHQEVFDRVLHGSLYEKGAAIGRGIIGDHPFVDGNKRTAMLAMLALLEMNERLFKAAPGEVEDFAVCIATERIDVSGIAEWLRRNSL